MREKTGGKLKLPFVRSMPISRNQFCRSRGRSHIRIYLYRTAEAQPAWPDLQTHGRTHRRADGHSEAQTDTQTGGRTRRSTDADAQMQTQKHGRRRRRMDADTSTRWRTDADASTRWRTDAKFRACSAWVEKSSRRILHLDERTRSFEVYYAVLLLITLLLRIYSTS